jgi:hypothetical protein
MNTKLPLHKILNRILYTQDKNKHNHEKRGNIKPQEKNRKVMRVGWN